MSVSGTAEAAVKAVAVAVTGGTDGQGGRGSLRAFHWALDNLLPFADRFVLVHVMPKITSIPTPSGNHVPIKDLDKNVVAMYVQDSISKVRQVFTPFKRLCTTRKVEIVLLEGDNPATTLLRCISELKINCLVMGSYSPPNFMARRKGADISATVLKYAPETCDTYIISKDRVITKAIPPLRDVSHSTQGEIRESPRSIFDRSSTSSSISAESHLLNELGTSSGS